MMVVMTLLIVVDDDGGGDDDDHHHHDDHQVDDDDDNYVDVLHPEKKTSQQPGGVRCLSRKSGEASGGNLPKTISLGLRLRVSGLGFS